MGVFTLRNLGRCSLKLMKTEVYQVVHILNNIGRCSIPANNDLDTEVVHIIRNEGRCSRVFLAEVAQ